MRINEGAASGAAPQLRALTGVRGLAAWFVVLFHFQGDFPTSFPTWMRPFVAQGYLAVDLFFILSGFVIALNYAERVASPDLRNYGRFLLLRLARVYPLHLFMLVMFLLNPLAQMLFTSSGDAGDAYRPAYFFQSLFLVQNWGFASSLGWNVPAWSISTEWAAYLLFPAIVWLVVAQLKGWLQNALFAVLLFVALAIFFSKTSHGLGYDVPKTGLLRCIVEFSVGVCAYQIWRNRVETRGADSIIALVLSLASAGFFVIARQPDYAVMPLGLFLLVYALADERMFLSRMLSNRAIEYLGLVSYSTYLSHFFIRSWIKFVLVRPGVAPWIWIAVYIVGTAIASVLLYRFVEVPGRRYGHALAERLVSSWARVNFSDLIRG